MSKEDTLNEQAPNQSIGYWPPMESNKNLERQSESIGKLAAALSKAQAKIKNAAKDSDNPFFKSKYSDLTSVWDACRKELGEHELAVIQTTTITNEGLEVLETTLAHSSGEWIRGVVPIKCKDASPQQYGSGMTYARRYGLAAIVGVAPAGDDDDANAAQEHSKASRKRADEHFSPDLATLQLLTKAANQGTGAFRAAWKKLSAQEKKSIGPDKMADFEATCKFRDEDPPEAAT